METEKIMNNIYNIMDEYYILKNDWLRNGRNIPNENDMGLVKRKIFLENIFDELNIDYKRWRM
jgi:hypothetical protein